MSRGPPRRGQGLGLFVRRLVGFDGTAVEEACAHYLDGAVFSVNQVRFVRMIVDELTVNGVTEPARLLEATYVDYVPTDLFPGTDVPVIADILGSVRRHAQAVNAASQSRVTTLTCLGRGDLGSYQRMVAAYRHPSSALLT